MPYACWLAGTVVNAAIWIVFSENVLKEAKLFILLALLSRRIHVLYSLGKSPMRLRMRTQMLTVSLFIIGCPERLAKVMPQKKREVSTSNPIEGCRLAANAIQMVSQSLAKVCPYLMTN